MTNRITGFVVGHPPLVTAMGSLLRRQGVQVELDPRIAMAAEFLFNRDSCVVRLDGSHLLPCRPEDSDLYEHLQALLPESSNQFIQNDLPPYGNGFKKEIQQLAKRYARWEGIPYDQAESCIEGGNCHLFIGRDDRSKAIVGVHSLVLTMLCCKESKIATQRPSSFALRMARNEELYQQIKPLFTTIERAVTTWDAYYFREAAELADWGLSLPEYFKKLQAPLTDEESVQYLAAAESWQARFEWAMETMQRELNVDDLVVLPQRFFHIDMELFVAEGVVWLHSARKVQELVSTNPLWEPYRAEAEAWLERGDDAHCQAVTTLVEKIGCAARCLPGIYCNGVEEQNFMNGVFINGHWITNAGPMLEVFQKYLPTLRCHGIEMGEVWRCGGGVHCATFERYRPLSKL